MGAEKISPRRRTFLSPRFLSGATVAFGLAFPQSLGRTDVNQNPVLKPSVSLRAEFARTIQKAVTTSVLRNQTEASKTPAATVEEIVTMNSIVRNAKNGDFNSAIFIIDLIDRRLSFGIPQFIILQDLDLPEENVQIFRNAITITDTWETLNDQNKFDDYMRAQSYGIPIDEEMIGGATITLFMKIFNALYLEIQTKKTLDAVFLNLLGMTAQCLREEVQTMVYYFEMNKNDIDPDIQPDFFARVNELKVFFAL